MSDTYHIVNTPLPAAENFSILKESGLAMIREYMNENWTNLNASDPGITILDQLCYALSELGYCINFPMSDILSDHNGTIRLENQFYSATQLLSTAPVTINDYRILIVGGVAGVKNTVIKQLDKNIPLYKVLVYADPSLGQQDAKNLCKEVFYLLNKNRNLGQLFLMPVMLEPLPYLLNGVITIDGKHKPGLVLKAIQEALQQYIFPEPIPENYPPAGSENINHIINGPALENGWIDPAQLGEKKNKLTAVNAVEIIRKVPGVITVSNISFSNAMGKFSSIAAGEDQLIVVDIPLSVQPTSSGAVAALQIITNNVPLPPSLLTQQMLVQHTQPSRPVIQKNPVGYAHLPGGNYRDINSYYSIQNTFPEIFRVGDGAVTAETPETVVAQSRQMKGYLTLFDQWLANQFSQLANIAQLFSFENALTGAPSDLFTYYAKQDHLQKANPEYPVPFSAFSPTYFYQSLYNVPEIRPLLKDNTAFLFDVEPQPAAVQYQNSWEEYMQDPYNAYIRGLMDLVNNEETDIHRRNNILNHLLARHGESPLLFDTVINGSVYTGNVQKDQVIIKSLYLQQLALLGYSRYKAYNFIAAFKVNPQIAAIPTAYIESIHQGVSDDLIFATKRINEREKIYESAFTAYAGIELKLNLFFALKSVYSNYIASILSDSSLNEESEIAYWFISQRCGFIMIETFLLNNSNIIQGGQQAGVVDAAAISDRKSRLVFIFPGFVPVFQEQAFQERLSFFLENYLPANIAFDCYYPDKNLAAELIPAFANWHNSMIWENPDDITGSDVATHAIILSSILKRIVNE